MTIPESLFRASLSPHSDGTGTHPQFPGHLFVPFSVKAQEKNPGTSHKTRLFATIWAKLGQGGSFLCGTGQNGGNASHREASGYR